MKGQDNIEDEACRSRLSTSICEKKNLACSRPNWRTLAINGTNSPHLDIWIDSAYTSLKSYTGQIKLTAVDKGRASAEILNKWDQVPEGCLHILLSQYDPEDNAHSKQWLPHRGSGSVRAKLDQSGAEVMAIASGDTQRLFAYWFSEEPKDDTFCLFGECWES